MTKFVEHGAIYTKRNKKSHIACDVLCALGFCLCDPDDIYSLCRDKVQKQCDRGSFDSRIPKRYRRAQIMKDTEPIKHSNTIYRSRDGASYGSVYMLDKISLDPIIKYATDDLALCKISAPEVKEVFSEPEIVYKILESQNLKKQIAITVDDIYIPHHEYALGLSSFEEIQQSSDKYAKDSNKLFVLPDINLLNSLDSSKAGSNRQLSDIELIDPFVLPNKQTSSDDMKINSTWDLFDEIKIKTSRQGSSTISTSKSEENLNQLKNSTESLNEQNVSSYLLISIDKKLDAIMLEITNLKLSIPALVRQEMSKFTASSEPIIQTDKSPDEQYKVLSTIIKPSPPIILYHQVDSNT